ncbi:hypothetical protein MGYG_05264 [Nannizzia gypsea CBS 118893]|uniref:Uncharacterized protein n=1 Tax=Arthroderma gypseum (strain ATCC MYA-4604 / CBS 118893) TaxID=535722 RepID=E4UVD6_ARTGP|nr:hypothetical protein MGYG_05264 [Nannizzia gypsea CBS 118893]EFR02263.1 hypothetical protein MGYG_05264 [Nannizzia gypsea CBS 118893]
MWEAICFLPLELLQSLFGKPTCREGGLPQQQILCLYLYDMLIYSISMRAHCFGSVVLTTTITDSPAKEYFSWFKKHSHWINMLEIVLKCARPCFDQLLSQYNYDELPSVSGLRLPSSTGWGRLTAQPNQRDNTMLKESRFLKSTPLY